MLETISSDVLDGVTGGQQTQNNGGQSCQGFINFNSCNNTQRDERNYGNQINPVTNVSALPPGEST